MRAATTLDGNEIDGLLKSIRALLQAARERVMTLQPLWGAHIANETLRHLGNTVSELEEQIAATDPHHRISPASNDFRPGGTA
jgi:hypothetical protein